MHDARRKTGVPACRNDDVEVVRTDAAREQHEAFIGKLAQCDPGLIGQAVIDRKGDDEVIGRDGPDCKRTDLVIEASEGEINLPIADGGERLRAVHFGERQ